MRIEAREFGQSFPELVGQDAVYCDSNLLSYFLLLLTLYLCILQRAALPGSLPRVHSPSGEVLGFTLMCLSS